MIVKVCIDSINLVLHTHCITDQFFFRTPDCCVSGERQAGETQISVTNQTTESLVPLKHDEAFP